MEGARKWENESGTRGEPGGGKPKLGYKQGDKGKWGVGKDCKGKLGSEPGEESEGGKERREARQWEMENTGKRIMEGGRWRVQ